MQPHKRTRLFGRILAAMLILQAHGVVVYAADGDKQTADPADVYADPADTTPDPNVAQTIAGEGRLDPYGIRIS